MTTPTVDRPRLVRNLLAAYGRAESTVFGRVGAEVAAQRVAFRGPRSPRCGGVGEDRRRGL